MNGQSKAAFVRGFLHGYTAPMSKEAAKINGKADYRKQLLGFGAGFGTGVPTGAVIGAGGTEIYHRATEADLYEKRKQKLLDLLESNGMLAPE